MNYARLTNTYIFAIIDINFDISPRPQFVVYLYTVGGTWKNFQLKEKRVLPIHATSTFILVKRENESIFNISNVFRV